MLDRFLENVVGEPRKANKTPEERVMITELRLIVFAALIVLCISVYWLVIDIVSDAYTLSFWGKIAVAMQFVASAYMIVLSKKYKEPDGILARLSFIIYYAIIAFGVCIITLSRSLQMLEAGELSENLGISVSSFYMFIIVLIPLPRILDSIIVLLLAVAGLIIPDIWIGAPTYSMFSHILLAFAIFIVYILYRKVLVINSIRENDIYDLNNTLLEHSYLDALTGILNRRALDEYLEYLVLENEKTNHQGSSLDGSNCNSGRKIGVLFFDIDYFKKYNDYYGHVEGDEALKKITSAISEKMSETAEPYVFRYGGEEFVYILEDGNEESIIRTMEIIRDAAYDAKIERKDIYEFSRVTVTVGGAIEEIPKVSGDYMSAADTQLYIGKNSKRNSIYFNNRRIRTSRSEEMLDDMNSSSSDHINDSNEFIMSQMTYNIETDELTGAYTRQAFMYHAKELINKNGPDSYKLVISDIDRFKLINDIYGESEGNGVLKYLARRFMEIEECIVCGRYGTDQFALLMDSHAFEDITQRDSLLETIRQESPLEYIGIKYGVYQDAVKSDDIQLMCDKAEQALKSIKHQSNETVAIYDGDIMETHYKEQMYEAQFERAIENSEFVVFCQPKYDTATKEITSAEALVRWKTEDGKYISPGQFIPVFESTGQIVKLDAYVFDYVLSLQQSMIEKYQKTLPISVNMSRTTLFQPGIVDEYLKMVEESGLDKELVPIELTESALIESDLIKDLVQKIKESGFKIHMDDFGAGYSTLSSLGKLPFDMLKLDKSLIDNIGNVNGDEILKHIIEIAHFLKMKVVAEGVENRDQFNFLRKLSCDSIQGYYFSKPLPFTEYEKLMVEGFRNASNVSKVEAGDEIDIGSLRITNDVKLRYLSALGSIYMTIHVIDLEHDQVVEFTTTTNVKAHVNSAHNAVEQITQAMIHTVADEYIPQALEFTDLTTLAERMRGKRSIERELKGKHFSRFETKFITVSMDKDEKPNVVLFTTRILENIDHEEDVSCGVDRTDELTGVLSRVALEQDVLKFAEHEKRSNTKELGLVVISMDVLDLRKVNEELGRKAGDELIWGAADCLNRTFGENGKVYRSDGDEFVVLADGRKISVDEKMAELKDNIENWMGDFVRTLTVSYGVATMEEHSELELKELISLAREMAQN